MKVKLNQPVAGEEKTLETYVDCKVRESKQVYELAAEVAQFHLEKPFFSFTENLERLQSLAGKVEHLSAQKELHPMVRKVIESIQNLLSHEAFALAYPIIDELEEQEKGAKEKAGEEVMPTIVSNLLEIAEEIRKTNSIEPFFQLDPVQQREVLNQIRGEGV